MVDNSPPKLMHKLFKDALCIHVSGDGYLWSGFNSAKLSTVATLIAPYGDIWQVGLKKADNNIWFCNGNSSFHVLIFDKATTGIQYPPSKNCKLEDHQYLLAKFSTKYIIGKQFVTLQCPVLLLPIKTYSAMRFGKRWVTFSKDNNLEEGDVCVSEVIERKLVVLSVSIFHVVDHQSLD
ncbi:b3 domain-containing protein rem19 [Quercus suber]|uniref:B3 domain-containing protein rem19 n=1 Tax=Quercus suber TaxID=58331 RepID=A0AAW0JS26_QUESU